MWQAVDRIFHLIPPYLRRRDAVLQSSSRKENDSYFLPPVILDFFSSHIIQRRDQNPSFHLCLIQKVCSSLPASTGINMERPSNIFKYAKWDPRAISSLASSLRNGVRCTIDPKQVPAGGSFNWAVFLAFEDGQDWVLRSPYDKSKSTILPALAGSLIRSEVATLEYLKRFTGIPVPTVHSFR